MLIKNLGKCTLKKATKEIKRGLTLFFQNSMLYYN